MTVAALIARQLFCFETRERHSRTHHTTQPLDNNDGTRVRRLTRRGLCISIYQFQRYAKRSPLLLHITIRNGSTLTTTSARGVSSTASFPTSWGSSLYLFVPGQAANLNLKHSIAWTLVLATAGAPEGQEYFALAEAVCPFILVLFYHSACSTCLVRG